MEKRMRKGRGSGVVFAALAVAALMLPTGQARGEDISPNGVRYADANNIPALTSIADIRYVNSAAGQLYADVMQSSILAQQEFRRALPSIYSYSQTAHAMASADIASDSAMAAVAVCPTTMCAPNHKWVTWDVPFAVRATKKRDDGYLGNNQNISGFATGISRMLSETAAIGLALGYDYRKLDGRDGYYMKNRADTFHAALFGGTAVGCFFVDGYLGYSRSWHRTERDVMLTGGTADRNSGNFNDTVLSAGMKISYVWILPNEVRITPSAGLDYSHVRFGGVNERADGASTTLLRMDKNTANQVSLPLMVSVSKTFSSSWFRFGGDRSLWTPAIRGGYVPVLGDKQMELSARNYAAGTDAYRLKSAKIGSYANIGAGVKLKIRDRFIFALDYDYRFASKYSNHTVTGSYGVSF